MTVQTRTAAKRYIQATLRQPTGRTPGGRIKYETITVGLPPQLNAYRLPPVGSTITIGSQAFTVKRWEAIYY